MRKVLLAVFLALAAGRAFAVDVDETLDADPKSRVNVSLISGSIEVQGWDRDQVKVTGRYEEDVEKFIFERDGRNVTVKIKAPERSWGQKNISAFLVIQVPQGSSLDIGVVSSDIEVEGVLGDQELQTVSGDITSEGTRGEIHANTVSGSVDVTSAGSGSTAGTWDLTSVSGDITAVNLAGEIEAEVVSGDIDIRGGSFRRVRAETVSGDIAFEGGLPGDGRLDMESVNGGIELVFTGEVSARFDVESFNGRISNCFGPKPERTSKYAPGIELNFTHGSGEGRVSLSTLNGGIKICNK